MPDRQPTDTKNLDIYGNGPLEWSRVDKAMSVDPTTHLTWFLGTVDPDGKPHAAGVGALYIDGDVYIVSGPSTRKSRNLAAQPACSLSVTLDGMDVVLEGEATRVTDKPALDHVVAVYRESGWPAEVEGDDFTAPYSAPSAGPPPWHLYRFVFETVVAVASDEPHGATRWRFTEGSDTPSS
jgi:hypothetical protein